MFSHYGSGLSSVADPARTWRGIAFRVAAAWVASLLIVVMLADPTGAQEADDSSPLDPRPTSESIE